MDFFELLKEDVKENLKTLSSNKNYISFFYNKLLKISNKSIDENFEISFRPYIQIEKKIKYVYITVSYINKEKEKLFKNYSMYTKKNVFRLNINDSDIISKFYTKLGNVNELFMKQYYNEFKPMFNYVYWYSFFESKYKNIFFSTVSFSNLSSTLEITTSKKLFNVFEKNYKDVLKLLYGNKIVSKHLLISFNLKKYELNEVEFLFPKIDETTDEKKLELFFFNNDLLMNILNIELFKLNEVMKKVKMLS